MSDLGLSRTRRRACHEVIPIEEIIYLLVEMWGEGCEHRHRIFQKSFGYDRIACRESLRRKVLARLTRYPVPNTQTEGIIPNSRDEKLHNGDVEHRTTHKSESDKEDR